MFALLVGLALQGAIPCVGTGDPVLQARARDFIQKSGYPGVWICIAKGGRIVATAAAGYNDIEGKRPAALDDVVRIGSISKPFVGTIIAEAVRQGAIRYSDTLYDVCPKLHVTGLPDYAPVTLEMLLTHHAGFPKDDRLTRFPTPPTPADYPRLREAEALSVVTKAPVSRPGEAFNYSNIGLELAAVMLETKTGKPYESWFREVVNGKMGLVSAGIGEAPPAHATKPYQWTRDGARPAKPGVYWPYSYGPYGSVHCTIEDLTRFGLVHCRGDLGSHVFSNELLDGMHRVVQPGTRTRSCFAQVPHRGRFFLHHSGGLASNYRGDISDLWLDPERGVVVAAYVNCISNDDGVAKSPVTTLQDDLMKPLFDALTP